MSVCFDPGLVVNCELSMAELSWLLTADLSFEKRVRCLLCKGSSPLGGGGGELYARQKIGIKPYS